LNTVLVDSRALRISGAVLSGGQSSRMGQEKGLMKLGGISLVERVAAAVSEVADEVVIAVAPSKIREYRSILDSRYKIVADKQRDQGPIFGLISGLSSASGDFVVVCPCDTPLVRPEVLKMIREKAVGFDCAVPVIRGYLEPLVACYSRTVCLSAFEKRVSSGALKLVDALKGLNVVRVPEQSIRRLDPELESFWNLNTPTDLAEAEMRLER